MSKIESYQISQERSDNMETDLGNGKLLLQCRFNSKVDQHFFCFAFK